MLNAIPVHAQNIQSLIVETGGLINILIGLVASIALLVFFWGLAVFIFNSGNEKKAEDGRRLMFWGVIALFVMFSIAGIIAFIKVALFGGPA